MTDAPRIKDRLEVLDSCALSDALDRLGLQGAILGLRALTVPTKIVGTAITVEVGPATDVPAKRHLGSAAVDAGAPATIIVVANSGRTDVACWGGILSLGASLRGVAGVVIDGAPRDIDEARELGLALYGVAPVQRTARGRIQEVSWNTPVAVCGIAVAPGDWLLADGSGVVVCPAARINEILPIAEEIAERERRMVAAVRAGTPVSQVMGASYEALLSAAKSAR